MVKRVRYRAVRQNIKIDGTVTATRFKLWQVVRWVKQAQALGTQNLIEDRILTWLQENGAEPQAIDYYLGYSKRAEELAASYLGYPLELLLDEIKREAAYRGLNADLILVCIDEGLKVKGWVEYASYFDRNGLAGADFPQARGCFCSQVNSVPLVSPEYTKSSLYPGLWYVNYRSRIFCEDLNNLIRALLYMTLLTPSLRVYYYPFAFFMGLETGDAPYFTKIEDVPSPWNILFKVYAPGDLIYAEDWNNILQVAEYLRLYWAIDLTPFPTRFIPGDTFKSQLYNEVVQLIEQILLRLPKPQKDLVLVFELRTETGEVPAGPSMPYVPAEYIYYKEGSAALYYGYLPSLTKLVDTEQGPIYEGYYYLWRKEESSWYAKSHYWYIYRNIADSKLYIRFGTNYVNWSSDQLIAEGVTAFNTAWLYGTDEIYIMGEKDNKGYLWKAKLFNDHADISECFNFVSTWNGSLKVDFASFGIRGSKLWFVYGNNTGDPYYYERLFRRSSDYPFTTYSAEVEIEQESGPYFYPFEFHFINFTDGLYLAFTSIMFYGPMLYVSIYDDVSWDDSNIYDDCSSFYPMIYNNTLYIIYTKNFNEIFIQKISGSGAETTSYNTGFTTGEPVCHIINNKLEIAVLQYNGDTRRVGYYQFNKDLVLINSLFTGWISTEIRPYLYKDRSNGFT
jgi:hypothetical protein